MFFAVFLVPMAMSSAFAQPPPPPPPHEMEPPEGVPPSLLELKAELSDVNEKYSAVRERLDEAIQASPGEHRGGFGGTFGRGELVKRMGKNHEIIRDLENLRQERGRIVDEAWGIFREATGPREGAGPPPMPPEKREGLEQWMMSAFGPPPREHGPFFEKGKGWGGHSWMFPGSPGQRLFERLERMEQRIGELEGLVERQQKEIEALRRQMGAGGVPENTEP